MPHEPTTPALDQMLADIRQLIECESPSSDHDALVASAELVAAIGVQRLGEQPERVDVDGCPHLRWRFGDRDAGRVLLLAHHDTVWPVGTLQRIPFGVEDGVLRGPGCFDMLTGLVMAIHAIAGLPDRDGVTLLVTGDEEDGSMTSRALIEREAREATAVFVLEASGDGGAYKTARKGTSIYEVAITGRAAHAGLEPEKGVNTSVELAHQVLAVTSLGDPDAGTSVTPTVVRSGTTTNTVPAQATIAIDVRAWTRAEQERVDVAIRALAPQVPGARLEVRGGINRPPLENLMSEALYQRAVTIAGRLGLPDVPRAEVGGASDGNFTAAIGVPTLDGMGAVGGGAHADDEHVQVDRIIDRTLLLGALVTELLDADAR